MSLHFVSAVAPGSLDAAHVLGSFELGARLAPTAASWPVQQVHAPLVEPAEGCAPVHEAWFSDTPASSGEYEGIRWRRAGDVLFGSMALPETGDGLSIGGLPPLQALSEQAYARIFRLLDAQELPHLWRVWNYLADITGESHGLERYRQFNLGRAQAFEHSARGVVGRVPAACAIGLASGPLSIAFLAGATPLVTIENPRQVSAFHYPADYGPRAPIFSRAALAYPAGQEFLFVSGTASIVGHRSLHQGQVQAQAREAMENVAAVLRQAHPHSRSGGFSLDALNYRVYLRQAADLPAVRSVMAARVGAAPVSYVQADICRRELLVEVEAVGYRALDP
jgi:chorismate lyase / 3-hydroxybenzoate synthase